MDIFIGNLPQQLDAKGLKKLVEIYATAQDVKIIKENGISRGFGFVKVAEENADRVIQGLNRKLFEGKKLCARRAQKKGPPVKRMFISKKWREKAPEKV